MAREWDIPKRYLRLYLYDGRHGGLESTTALSFLNENARISFQTATAAAELSPSATINIGGLLRDKMGYLATSYTSWLEQSIQNRIVIDAGYNGQHGVLFDGNVIEAIPSLDSADFNISLKCQSEANYLQKNIASITKEGEATVKEIAEKIAKELEVKLIYYPDKDYKVNNYSLSDASLVTQMRYLSKISGLEIYCDKKRMYVKEPLKPIKGKSLVINSNNIIGAPRPDAMGCRVQIRMTPNIQSGMPASLESLRFPILNSENYYVQQYNHTGETKGNKWFTEVDLVRSKIWQQ